MFLYGEDGASRQLAQNVSKDYRNGWFLDGEGNYFVCRNKVLYRLDEQGNEMYQCSVGGMIQDICQLQDGSIILMFRDSDGQMKIGELDSEARKIVKNDKVYLGENTGQYIGAGNTGLLLLNKEGVWEIDIRTGEKKCVISFQEYAYELQKYVLDFCMNEEGAIELLSMDEKITLLLVNISKTREIIRLRNIYNDYDLETAATKFNKGNDKYYVLIEKLTDTKAEQEYITRTNLELISGGGPDIISGVLVEDVESLMEKGVLEDLTPYLLESGISESDYFPAAFALWRKEEAIYGIATRVRTQGLVIDREFVQGNVDIEVEDLLDKMLEYSEEAVFVKTGSSTYTLDYFLSGSEVLWGMVDWENSKCDFSGEFFKKLLQVAKRYGDNGQNDHPALAEYTYAMNGFYNFWYENLLEKKGKAYLGVFFDDGNYPAQYTRSILGMNSNSAQKEGVWEFFSFLLSEEQQTQVASPSVIPVSKKAFEAVAEKEIEEGAVVVTIRNGKPSKQYKNSVPFIELERDEEAYRALYDLTEEKVVELRAHLESAKVMPRRTYEIRSIIAEESGAYFSGSKSMEQVIEVIQNRVQLYLEENSL